MLATDYYVIRGDERPRWTDILIDAAGPEADDVTPFLMLRNPIVHSSVMMRRSTLVAVGGYSVDVFSQFDYELWIRLARRGALIRRLDLALAAKRLHRGQLFKGHGRFVYARRSVELQRDAIAFFGLGRWEVAIILSRLICGVLPSTLSRRVRRAVERMVFMPASLSRDRREPVE